MRCKQFITERDKVEGAEGWLQVAFTIYFFSFFVSSILLPEKGLVLKNEEVLRELTNAFG
jgi:hypothetical protein